MERPRKLYERSILGAAAVVGGIALGGCSPHAGWNYHRQVEVVNENCSALSKLGPCATFTVTFRECPQDDFPEDSSGDPPLKLDDESKCIDLTRTYTPDSFPDSLAIKMTLIPGEAGYPT